MTCLKCRCKKCRAAALNAVLSRVVVSRETETDIPVDQHNAQALQLASDQSAWRDTAEVE